MPKKNLYSMNSSEQGLEYLREDCVFSRSRFWRLKNTLNLRITCECSLYEFERRFKAFATSYLLPKFVGILLLMMLFRKKKNHKRQIFPSLCLTFFQERSAHFHTVSRMLYLKRWIRSKIEDVDCFSIILIWPKKMLKSFDPQNLPF